MVLAEHTAEAAKPRTFEQQLARVQADCWFVICEIWLERPSIFVETLATSCFTVRMSD